MSASLSGEFNLQAFTDLGAPLIGGRLYTYNFGTTTHKTAYTDHAGTIPHTYTSDGLGGQYIALNARGELSAPLYLVGGSYDLSLKRADGSTLWTRRADPVWDITNDLSGNGGAALIGYTPAGTGAVPTTVGNQLRFIQVNNVHVKDAPFYAECDGVTDDTLAMLKAFEYCRATNQILRLSGRPVFNLASVPAPYLTAGDGGFYVNACSMVGDNNTELLVTGKVGFSLQGVDRTVVAGFDVTTFGREMGESSLEASCPFLFCSRTGTKKLALYKDLKVNHTVTDLTGSYRAGFTVYEHGADTFIADTVSASNTIVGVAVFSAGTVITRNTSFKNTQTGLYFNNVGSYQVNVSSLVNTASQAVRWVAKTNATQPRLENGMDHMLVEGGDNGTVIGLFSVYAIERASYIQSSNVHQSACYTLNSSGYKVVGLSYTNQSRNAYIDGCHVYFDSGYVNSATQIDSNLVAAYWGKNLSVSNCSIVNDSARLEIIQAAIALGYPDGSTYDGARISNVTARGVQRLCWSFMCEKTAAQLAAMTPAGSFVGVRNVTILDCNVKLVDYQTVRGALFEVRYGSTNTAESVLQLAAENIEIGNNTIDNATASLVTRAEWLYSVRWVNGLRSYNNKVTAQFKTGGYFDADFNKANPPSLMTVVPYSGIRIQEPFLRYGIDSGALVEQLSLLTLLADSQVKFTVNNGLGQRQTVEAVTSADHAFTDGYVSIGLFGKDFAAVTTARSFAIDMTAKGDQYFGKLVGGTITNQVGTQPINLTYGGGQFAVRGESQPTVRYRCNLTLV